MMTDQEYEDKFGIIPVKPDAFDYATFDIEVVSMKTKTVNNNTNVVHQVNFCYTCKVNEETASQEHDIFFDDDSLSQAESFVPFAELTKDQVIGWIMNKVPYIHMQYSLANRFVSESVDVVLPPWADA